MKKNSIIRISKQPMYLKHTLCRTYRKIFIQKLQKIIIIYVEKTGFEAHKFHVYTQITLT